MADPVFHLATPDAWAAAQGQGEVVPASLAEEGFIHCSTLEQVVGTIERHFTEVDELVLLELDPATTTTELRWEEGRPGQLFPHLYRPLRVTEVRRAIPWCRGPDGSVTLPPQVR